MDDSDMSIKEWEGDFDPLADPDEKQHLLSVLDSFRSVALLERHELSLLIFGKIVSPASPFQWHSRPTASILFLTSRTLDDAIETTLLNLGVVEQVGRSY